MSDGAGGAGRGAPAGALRHGPGRALIAVYALFALSATARSGVQLATRFDEAPVPYLLSAFAALLYALATVALARGSESSRALATVICLVELVGVVVVGTISMLAPEAFPEATVWSGFGSGYGYVPLLLPVLGLAWLRIAGRGARAARDRRAR
ncbi:hypothetical protein SAMN06265360_106201 [Haloechinothrix alba]|uniref:Integral membrane protein n=1 Tax=Haloechinothrix alba TaxID=664784 RepID=A0A238WJ83_9PSEU|nr:hypothetical protein [Haloechinothrix alba]SNR46294.1 hypothetical protein SAMN06265360_106201 [Haloechinothrix alba]